jgi:coenzyme F420-reducing hydrogenase delta subunit
VTDTHAEFEPRITAFVCNWCTYTGADLAGTSRLHMASNVRIIRLPCTGRIDPLFIIKAFERGADGVIVSGCHPADCHYTAGNYHARRRFALFHDLVQFLGIDPDELHDVVEHGEAPASVVVARRVVAVGRVAAADDHAVGAALEGLDDEEGVHAACAGQTDEAHVARHVQAARAGQVGAGVGAPVADEGRDAGLEVGVCVAHGSLTPTRRAR